MRKRAYFAAVLGIAFIAGLPAAMALAQTKTDKAVPADVAKPPQLPGGASALSETHGDWTVNCQIIGKTKACSLSHQQFNKQNGQRLLAIELATKAAEQANGTLALPFGLALAKGINLEVDDKKLEGILQFSTCQAVGCLVPVTFDAKITPLLKAATILKINAVAVDTGQPISFPISLAGFSGALARTAGLSAD
ncbi:invasion associated locus B family protein [Mesorhizobium sp. M6A.T.Ce.TU.016.01.1.1]|uniref:invasion associated locus B family protein n=1 Tax=Mesorhizobium sp. M6A.T.Ce.TU.016.01.1.1 TaxID=2496783 RepID=UPI000FCC5210|nr:invasion associated locus B family protein [Mesorhizobium sp. M6A.T.Ce.TU.016.01.1.1]RUU26661.1 Invasion associated locus B family protein [Mesorhizobium sp. M6A.T.Ce.TU.016.01.1.1]